MACCAFAVFLLAQLLAPFVWVRRALMGDTHADNDAVAWAPGASVVAHPSRHPRSALGTAFAVVLGLELAAGGAAVAWSTAAFESGAVFQSIVPSATPTMSMAAIEAAALEGAWCRGIHALWEG